MPSIALPRLRAFALAGLLAALFVGLHAAAPARAEACSATCASITSASSTTLEHATVCLINHERAQRGRGRLTVSSRLSKAAARHSADMARRNYFSHVSPAGSTFLTRIKRTGYLNGARSWSAAENIAWGSGEHGTPRSIVRAWMRSSGHRANILGRFRNVGLGIVRGTPANGYPGGATYTNTFGRR